MLHLLINPVSRYTLFFQLPKPFKFDTKPQNTNSSLQITLLHPFKSGKLSHQRKEKSGTAPSSIQTEASKKVNCIIDSYFIIYMSCTFIFSIYIIHIIRLVCISGTAEHRGWVGLEHDQQFGLAYSRLGAC